MRVVLGPDFSVRAIASAREEISGIVDSEKAVALDGSSVEQADLAGVQLLISALATARRVGCALTITAMSDTLAKALTRAGLRLSAGGDRIESVERAA